MGDSLQSSDKMRSMRFLLLASVVLLTQGNIIPECCVDKSVGGVDYVLVATNETQAFGCKTNCIYAKKDSPSEKFCFKQGDLPVECEGTIILDMIDESCFPEESRGCPPKENLRIVRQEFDTLTTQTDYNACWNHCKYLYGTPPYNCIAWTFDSTHQNCYTYKTLPACYNTAEYSGWYSGQESCEIDVSCFPGESDRGCPPKDNLRIVRQHYDTFSRQANYTACWDHCRELQANSPNGCFAWTFSPDKPEGGCFTYNSSPACYNTGEYPGWYSGQESCP